MSRNGVGVIVGFSAISVVNSMPVSMAWLNNGRSTFCYDLSLVLAAAWFLALVIEVGDFVGLVEFLDA